MKATRKDYAAMAKALGAIEDADNHREVVEQFIEILRGSNPAFKAETFRQACEDNHRF